MARPIKRTIDTFPHEVHQPDALFVMESRFGNDGYAAWFKLREILCSSPGLSYECNSPARLMHLSARLRVSDELALRMLDTLADMEVIDRECWKRRVIWWQELVDGLRETLRKRSGFPARKPPYSGVSGAETSPPQDGPGPVLISAAAATPPPPDFSPVSDVSAAETPSLPSFRRGNAPTAGFLPRKPRFRRRTSSSLPLRPSPPQTPLSPAFPRPRKKQAKKAPLAAMMRVPGGFERFCEAHPVKAGTMRAWKAWVRLNPDQELVDRMLHALEAQKQSALWQAGRGIPHPATWLNEKRWTDELAPPARHDGKDGPPDGPGERPMYVVGKNGQWYVKRRGEMQPIPAAQVPQDKRDRHAGVSDSPRASPPPGLAELITGLAGRMTMAQ
jgi:hypothetical protein